MRSTYTFVGIVFPERAQMSIEFNHEFRFSDEAEGKINCSVINNQLLAILEIDIEIDIMTLRNIVYQMIQTKISAIGFYTGHYYDVKIDRIYNNELSVNYVYGIENTDISSLWGGIDLQVLFNDFIFKTSGHSGVFLNRGLNDLMNALKNIDDAAFFCYRAIESLKNHHSFSQQLLEKNESTQWNAFREKAQCAREEIDSVKKHADDLRHGKPVILTAEEVKKVLVTTWGIVRKYIENL